MNEIREQLEDAFKGFRDEIDHNFRGYKQYTINLVDNIYDDVVNDKPDFMVFGCLFSWWWTLRNVLEICREDIMDYDIITDMAMVLDEIMKLNEEKTK